MSHINYIGLGTNRSLIPPSLLVKLMAWAEEFVVRYGLPHSAIAIAGPKFRPGYIVQLTNRMRIKLAETDPASIRWFSRMAGFDKPVTEENECFNLTTDLDPVTSVNVRNTSCSLSTRIAETDLLLADLNALAGLIVNGYGWLSVHKSNWWTYVFRDPRPVQNEEEYQNADGWGKFFDVIAGHTILRDIYPISFLTKPYLDLKMGDATLQRWIESSTANGRIEPLNATVSAWHVAQDQVGRIREELFRAGVLFYYRFFEDWFPDNPWIRDFSKPFRCPDVIPEIFRADYVRIGDRIWI